MNLVGDGCNAASFHNGDIGLRPAPSRAYSGPSWRTQQEAACPAAAGRQGGAAGCGPCPFSLLCLDNLSLRSYLDDSNLTAVSPTHQHPRCPLSPVSSWHLGFPGPGLVLTRHQPCRTCKEAGQAARWEWASQKSLLCQSQLIHSPLPRWEIPPLKPGSSAKINQI